MENIVLLFGGKSCEHDISIITALQVYENINKDKYKIYPIYIDKNNVWWWTKNHYEKPQDFINFNGKNCKQVFLKSGNTNLFFGGKFGKTKVLCKVVCALVCCHGDFGEDGKLQGLLEMSGIAYTSCGTTSSAVCMDKVFMKQVFEMNNLPVTKYCFFAKNEYFQAQSKVLQTIKKQLDFPVIIKPANLGSSIGITIAHNLKEMKTALDFAFRFDKKVVVEEVIEHLREINCAILGDDEKQIISELDEPVKTTEFFDFNQKYLEKNIKSIKHKAQPLPKYIKDEIRQISILAFKLLDCKGVVRIDFLYNNDTEELFISEVNSIPGSLSHFMFKNKTFSEFIDELIVIAKKEEATKQDCVQIFESCVLERKQNFGKK